MNKKENYYGVASLFEKVELKHFFSGYLYFILGTEFLIFLVIFLGNLSPNETPFPWKFYFYVSFITPIATTFILGIFIIAFNHFMFDSISKRNEDTNKKEGTSFQEKSKRLKINLILDNIKQIPLLPVLFSIIAATVLLYKIDAIFLFFFSAGEKVVNYMLIALIFLLSATLIFGIIWIFVHYNLSKKQMEHEYKYRNDVMDKLGLLIANDSIIVSKDSKIFDTRNCPSLENTKIELKEKKNIQNISHRNYEY